MSLLANLNAFKNKVKTAPVISSAKRPVKSQSQSPPSTASTHTTKRRMEEDEDVEFGSSKELKRPAHDSMSSAQLSTKLLLAVEYIKAKTEPLPVEQLFSYLNLNTQDQRDKMLSLLEKLDKVNYDKSRGTLEYVSIHNIKDKDNLLVLLRKQPTFKGISVKELKDGWNGCIDAIKELEEEGKVLVLKTKKDGNPRLVWSNVGGELGTVDEEFVKVWSSVKLPERADLPGKLNKLGLKPASVDPATVKKETDGQEMKKRKSRKGKITNTHMAGILKDYST